MGYKDSNILTPEQLGELNNVMLGRGAPVEYDDMGYNKYDYLACKAIDVPSLQECYKLSSILVKYAKTQLNLDTELLKTTSKYYEKYVKTIQVLRHDEDGLWVTWKYSKEVREAIGKIGGFAWNKTFNGWECHWFYEGIDGLISTVKSLGYGTESVEETLKETQKIYESECKDSIAVSESYSNFKLSVKRKDVNTLSINVPFNPENIALQVRTKIKALPYWRFNKQEKTWEIDLDDVSELCSSLSLLDNIDMDSLESFIIPSNSEYELIDYSHLKRQPRDFQVEDARIMLKAKRIINANEMGCGKTYECILAGESIPRPKLVIVPASLRLNWVKEIKFVNLETEINVIHNSEIQIFKPGKRLEYSTSNELILKEWNIIGYSSLDTRFEELQSKISEITVVFADEAHYIKAINNSGHPDSNRAEKALYLMKTAEYCFPITGTPKTNRNKDLYNPLKAIKHPMTKRTKARDGIGWSNFAHTYCDAQHNGWGWNFNGSSNDSELHERIKDFMIRRRKAEVLPHLKKMRDFIPVEIDLSSYRYEIAEYMKKRSNKAGERLVYLNRARFALAEKKAQKTVDFISSFLEQGLKVVIGTNYTNVVKALEKAYKDKCIKIIGGMSDLAKNEAIEQFQSNPDITVCIANIVAGGVGITLTASHTLIINDFDWTPGNMLQFEDRVCRDGQTEEYCNIYYMYAMGAEMDEMLAEIMEERLDSINDAIDGGEGESIPVVAMIEATLRGENKVGKTTKNKKSKSVEENCPVRNSINLTIEELKTLNEEKTFEHCRKYGITWKENKNSKINLMRAKMALKEAIK